MLSTDLLKQREYTLHRRPWSPGGCCVRRLNLLFIPLSAEGRRESDSVSLPCKSEKSIYLTHFSFHRVYLPARKNRCDVAGSELSLLHSGDEIFLCRSSTLGRPLAVKPQTSWRQRWRRCECHTFGRQTSRRLLPLEGRWMGWGRNEERSRIERSIVYGTAEDYLHEINQCLQ